VTATKVIPGRQRLTINLEAEHPSLANAAAATRVDATLPIIVERSQYRPDLASSWYEAHNSFGVTALGTKWGLAEGRVGGTQQAQTYILIANRGSTEATVTITFLRENALAPVTKTFHVARTSRFNVAVGGADVPEIANERFGGADQRVGTHCRRARALLECARSDLGRGHERDRGTTPVVSPTRFGRCRQIQ
jgi:hypothetical protein